jgi:tRNA threonylcarbamoyladenosine biosynthesis protein TsaE
MRISPEQFVSRSPEETQEIAAGIAPRCPGRCVLALFGQLGSGKTCFVQGLARAVGVPQTVISPTFTLIREYGGDRPLYHVDLYRVSNADEALDLGLDEYFERDGITAIEWADRATEILPPDTCHIRFTAGAAPTERHIAIDGLS